MMDIEALLEKYYNGDTSPEEERLIREYFEQHPEQGHTPDALLFGATGAARAEKNTVPSAPKRLKSFKRLLAGGPALAAGIALFFILRQSSPSTQQPILQPSQPVSGTLSTTLLVTPKVSGTIQDEQQALEQARKALTYVSSKLNKGVNGINHFNKLEQSLSKIQSKEKS